MTSALVALGRFHVKEDVTSGYSIDAVHLLSSRAIADLRLAVHIPLTCRAAR